MAVCEWCGQEMVNRVGCTVETYDDFADGVPTKRLRYRDKVDCHDCGVPPGSFHHPGCDWERCPRCRRQALTCDCEKRRRMWLVPDAHD
jgi:hypothetical protein